MNSVVMPNFAPTQTPRQKLATLRTKSLGQLRDLQTTITATIKIVWADAQNPPQAYFDELGIDGNKTAQQHAAAIAFLAAVGLPIAPDVLALIKPISFDATGKGTVAAS